MNSSRKSIGWLALCIFLTFVAPLTAQQKPQPPAAESGATAPEAPADPLGRETPRGTLIGFLKAARDGNYRLAAQYFQSTARRQTHEQDEVLARQFQEILDHLFTGNLNTISQSLSGELNDSLPRDRESLGEIQTAGVKLDLLLAQVADQQGGRIWLFEWQMLRQIPGIYEKLLVPRLVHQLVPRELIETRLLSMPLWIWMSIVLCFFLAFGLAWLLILILRLIGRLARSSQGLPVAEPNQLFRISPLTFFVTLCLHFPFVDTVIGLPVLYRQFYMEIMVVLLAATLYWVLLRVTNDAAALIGKRLVSSGRLGAHSLLILGSRVFKIACAIALLLSTIRWFGVDVTTALAGLGIGGLALGLGAQKTLDNFFGGITVLTDDALRVGDLCKIGDQLGTVEDVSLRSTRLRRADRVVVSIPNGQVAQANLENYSRRDGILFRTSLALRFDTSADQMRFLLASLREMLYRHPKVDKNNSCWVRLTGLGSSSFTVDISALVPETQFMDFIPVQEDLLLRIMDIVEQAGAVLAVPAQTLQLGRDRGLDQEKARAAAAAVEEWRQQKRLPFPDHDRQTVDKLRDTLAYPPEGSSTSS